MNEKTDNKNGKKSDFPYLHGFSPEEQDRLRRQAEFTEHSIYQSINFSNAKNVLEVGCGVGAQSEILLRRFPNVHLTGIDLSPVQLDVCKNHLESLSWTKDRYNVLQMDASHMEFESNSYDGAFLCWVLEHVPDPRRVLSEVRRVVRPGGKVVINEVMNNSFFLDPYSPNVWHYWMAFNDYQLEIGGDPFIGIKLGNALLSLGFRDIQTEVKTWYFDNRLPERRKEYIDFWTELMLSAADHLIAKNYVTEEVVDNARKELKRVANDPNAVFYFSFMQSKAKVF
jgi:ubiquinone/menaquinone biosynthesis C-methylase UbiE